MSHIVHDKRSLLMHRLIARRLRREPALRSAALANLRRWTEAADASESRRRAANEWLPLLEGPLDRLIMVMTERGERGQQLRQSSPFAGEAFIRQTERMRVLKKSRV
jgi:hypothetical protein